MKISRDTDGRIVIDGQADIVITHGSIRTQEPLGEPGIVLTRFVFLNAGTSLFSRLRALWWAAKQLFWGTYDPPPLTPEIQ